MNDVKCKGCFAYTGNACRILRVTTRPPKCKFYKTEQQLNQERERSVERIEKKYRIAYRDFIGNRYGSFALKLEK